MKISVKMCRKCIQIFIYGAFLVIPATGCIAPVRVPQERVRHALQLVDAGTAHLRVGRLDEALRMFTLAEELAPIAPAVDGKGCVALLHGDFVGAEDLFKAAYQMDSTYDEALGNLALLMDVSGHLSQARMLYNQVVSQAPGDVRARINRAALEYDLGRRKIETSNELMRAGLLGNSELVSANLTRLEGR